MRYLKNFDRSLLTQEFLSSLDWDIVEFDLRIDPMQAFEYYQTLRSNLDHLKFNFNSKEYIRDEIFETYQKEGRVGNYLGNVDAWTVSWPVERDIPCPSRTQARPEVFPEIKDIHDMEFLRISKIQEKYKFGIFNKILDRLSTRALKQILIVSHSPGLKVLSHTDGFVKKLHIPLYTNPNAVFTFGENRERVYQMEVGKIYMINTRTTHGTQNDGSTERVHLLSRIDLDYIPEVAAMQGIIE